MEKEPRITDHNESVDSAKVTFAMPVDSPTTTLKSYARWSFKERMGTAP